MKSKSSGSRLAPLLSEMARGEGTTPSRLPEVKFIRAPRRIARTPIVYEPGIFIVAQGRKIGYWGSKKIVFDPGHYLVMSVPLPFECETEGSPKEPLLAVKIGVTPAAVTELLMQMEQLPPTTGSEPQIMEATALDDTLTDAAVRLLKSLRCMDDARILGGQIVREIIYHVLRGKLGRSARLPPPTAILARSAACWTAFTWTTPATMTSPRWPVTRA